MKRTEFSDATRERLFHLESLARQFFADVTVLAGSSSVRLGGRVRVKLVPTRLGVEEVVLIGVAAEERVLEWLGTESTIGSHTINGRPFDFFAAGSDDAFSEELLRGLHDRHALGEGEG